MNTRAARKMIGITMLLLAGGGPILTGLARADDIDDALLHQAHEFQLGNGEHRIIAEHQQPESYRVCVQKGPDAVPLTAQVDGTQQTIGAGDCADLNGKVIELKPAARMKQDDVLIGKFEQRR